MEATIDTKKDLKMQNLIHHGTTIASTGVGFSTAFGATEVFPTTMKSIPVQAGMMAASVLGAIFIKGDDLLAKGLRAFSVGAGTSAFVNIVREVTPKYMGTAPADESKVTQFFRASTTGSLAGLNKVVPIHSLQMPNRGSGMSLDRTYNPEQPKERLRPSGIRVRAGRKPKIRMAA